jgi:general secretion pathway protein D
LPSHLQAVAIPMTQRERMRSLRGALALLVLFASMSAPAESAKSLFKKGVSADAREDYEAAYTYYKAAWEKQPKNLEYKIPYQRTRFLAAAAKVKRGQKLRDAGKLQEAANLFQQAAEIDPSNELAVQELRRTLQMIQAQPATPAGDNAAPAPVPHAEDPIRKRIEEARPPVELQKLSEVALPALKMTEDTRVIYETLGKLAGLNVLFDPDFASKRVSIDLQHVSLREALDIVSLESKSFWRPVTPNTIFVAQDNKQKRSELEQNVFKVFYLGNNSGGAGASTGTDLQDIVTSIRTITDDQKVQHIPSQNAIIMKGTPDQIALAQTIIDDLDKVKPEVVVDVIVAQVTHSKTRDVGITPPQNASVALQGTNAATTTTGTGATPSTGLNFQSLEHLTEGNFALTVDSASAALLNSLSNAKILQSPRVRSSDNEKASLKIVSRIPVATGSFGTPLGVTGGANLGVNTQFSFIDVGVTLEITPHVHPEGAVTLKTSVELSSQTDTRIIGGVAQPVIGTKKSEQTIRLKDGEPNLLGGLIEDSETIASNGTPFLSSIPVLKFFFSHENVQKSSNEIVFILVPHIVRGREYSPLNDRAIDIGTANGIELRSLAAPIIKIDGDQQAGPSGSPAPAQPGRRSVSVPPAASTSAPVTSAPPAVTAPQNGPSTAAPPVANATPSSSAAGPTGGDAVAFHLDPPQVAQAQGSSFTINVSLSNAHDVAGVPLQITYDPNVLQFVSVSNGGFLTKDGQAAPLVNRNDATTGTLQITAQRPPGVSGLSGDGTVFNLVFMAKAKGSGVVAITIPGARNSQNQPIKAMGSQAAVTVN